MKLLEFIKESTPIDVESIQRKQYLHNLIEDAWQRKLIEQKYNNYSSTPKNQ